MTLIETLKANGNLRHFDRQPAPPPGRLELYEKLDPQRSLEAISQCRLPISIKALLTELLKEGSIETYPDGIGLGYASLLKYYFDTPILGPVLRDLVLPMSEKVDAFLAPEHSATLSAGFISALTNKPVVPVWKNRGNKEISVGATIKSYTGGGIDTMLINREVVNKFLRKYVKHLGIFDEIMDTDTMASLVMYLNELLKQLMIQRNDNNMELPIVSEAFFLFMKLFTGGLENFEEQFGIKPKYAVGIKDMGNKPYSWIVVEGLDGIALTFPTPTP